MKIIDLVAQDLLRGSSNMCGKVRSNFVGTEFSVFDSCPRAASATGTKGDMLTQLCAEDFTNDTQWYMPDRTACTVAPANGDRALQ